MAPAWPRTDDFPRADLDSSRRDRRLQARHHAEVEEARARDAVCPECGSGEHVSWFWFESPDWTWEHLCGRAGVLAWCDAHERQIAFELHVMN